eukprot:6839053-Karenia_brevis.AAC.1
MSVSENVTVISSYGLLCQSLCVTTLKELGVQSFLLEVESTNPRRSEMANVCILPFLLEPLIGSVKHGHAKESMG